MVLRIARGHSQALSAIREGGVLRVEQNQFVFIDAVRQPLIDFAAVCHRGVVDGRRIFGAGQQQPGNRNLAERLFRLRPARNTGAEHDGGFDAGIGKSLAHESPGLAADSLRGDGTEGVARHADVFEVETLMKALFLVVIPFRQLIEHRGDILITVDRVLQ